MLKNELTEIKKRFIKHRNVRGDGRIKHKKQTDRYIDSEREVKEREGREEEDREKRARRDGKKEGYGEERELGEEREI